MDAIFKRNTGSRGASVIDRRSVLTLISAALMPSLVSAAQYPSRPIKIIVPFGPGGSGDITARLIGKQIEEKTRQADLAACDAEVRAERQRWTEYTRVAGIQPE